MAIRLKDVKPGDVFISLSGPKLFLGWTPLQSPVFVNQKGDEYIGYKGWEKSHIRGDHSHMSPTQARIVSILNPFVDEELEKVFV